MEYSNYPRHSIEYHVSIPFDVTTLQMPCTGKPLRILSVHVCASAIAMLYIVGYTFITCDGIIPYISNIALWFACRHRRIFYRPTIPMEHVT